MLVEEDFGRKYFKKCAVVYDRSWGQWSRFCVVWDAAAEADTAALHIAADGTSTRHSLRLQRHWKNLPCSQTCRVSDTAVSMPTVHAEFVMPIR